MNFMKIIDLTHTINENIPVFSPLEKPKLSVEYTCKKDGFTETKLTMFSHTGTHIDAPAHIVDNGKTLDSYSIDCFVGKALVIDCKSKQEGELITLDDLSVYEEKIKDADFLLFNIGWDKKWGTDEYFGNYPCINDDVLDYIIKGNFKGIGFDTMSLDSMNDSPIRRHKRLFAETNIINIENLKNLDLCGSVCSLYVVCR